MTRTAWSRAILDSIEAISDDDLLHAAQIFWHAGLVLTAGNGGSSAIASHAAQAIAKPDYAAGGGRAAVCLSDNVPGLTAHANDGGWEGALAEAARPFLDTTARVAILAISSSGRSANVLCLAELARSRNVPVIALTGFRGEPLRSIATLSLHVDAEDYEVVEPTHDAILHRIQYHVRALGGAKGK